MLKKILGCLLVFVLLFLTACGGNTGVKECTEGATLVGNTESRDPLRICIDMSYSTPENPEKQEKAWADLLFRLKETMGLEDVVLEIIPPPATWEGVQTTVARETVIDRLRAEIMAGKGPDVFLMRYMVYDGPMGYAYDETDCLFKYPQKAMENGVFLPLDEYMKNNTELAEWDKLTPQVLEAGRNEEGQQIIPLSYTLPLLCCPKSEWEHIPDKKYTWNDMLTNPELLPYSLDLANCGYVETMMTFDYKSTTEFRTHAEYLKYIMGEFADYENEELGFTEEELLARVNEILALEQTDQYEKIDEACELYVSTDLSNRKFNKPMTFLPIYNMDGGVTAHVEKYAAVNRNTERPEDAFKVIDLLMSKYVQRWGDVYNYLIYERMGILMHEELFQESDPLIRDNYYMTPGNFEAFCKVREQITGANIESEGTTMLAEMMNKCFHPESYNMTVEEIVHETYEDMTRRVRE